MKKLLLSAILTLTACGNPAATFSTRVGAPSNAAPLTLGGVEVDRIRMVVSAIEVERGDEQNEVEFEAGPYLLDLSGAALEGGVVAQFSAAAPAGTYDELEFEIRRLEGEMPADEGLQEMFTRGASIVIDGTVNGTPFSFESDIDEKQELEGSFEIGGAGGGDNVTLNIDPTGWFVAADGSPLDPNNPEHEDQIEQNIHNTFEAYDDDDSDGDDDAEQEL